MKNRNSLAPERSLGTEEAILHRAALLGRHEAIQILIRAGRVDLDAKIVSLTALMKASSAGFPDVVH